MWPKFGNSSISLREIIIISILWPEEALFWRGGLGTGTSYEPEVFQQCGKRFKTKSQKVFVANSYVCRSYMEKTGSGTFCSPIVNRVKVLKNAPHQTKYDANFIISKYNHEMLLLWNRFFPKWFLLCKYIWDLDENFTFYQ